MGLVLAIDFDGVVHDHTRPVPGRKMGPPMDGAKDALVRLKQNGHQIIIFSVWGDRPKVIADWMAYWEIPYDQITNVKPNADAYIDDKAIPFTSWVDLMGVL